MNPLFSLHLFRRALFVPALFSAAISFIFVPPAFSHCDGLDGPVVASARLALQEGNVNRVLIWVRREDKKDTRQAFEEARAVRKLSSQAESLADRSFFETLVRIHRAGEGAPYTGLKAAGRDLGPAIPAADKAISSGADEKLVQLLTKEMQDGIAARFRAVMEKKHSM
jgi:hypothetical protein